MKNNWFNSTTGWLMLLSQVLLTMFLVQWISSQYYREKEILEKQLRTDFSESQQQLLDSVIVKKLILPVMNDSSESAIKMWKQHDSAEVVAIVSTDSLQGNFEHSFTHQHGDSIQIELHSSELLLDGVRLFVNEVNQISGDSVKFQQFLPGISDTIGFSKIIGEKFKENGFKFVMNWTKDSTNNKSIFLHASNFPGEKGMSISGYNGYLFRKITPEISFSVLLILLTCGAFYLSYRNEKKALQLSQLRNDFINNISHELRTPVSTVKVALESLIERQSENSDQKLKEYLRMASLETQRLEQLVDKVMSLAQSESGNQLFEFQLIDLRNLVEQTIDSLKFQIESSSTVIMFSCDENSQYMTNADATHVRGVLVNLIENSIRYSGDEKKRIEIDLKSGTGKIELSVRDHGPGIPSEYHEKVFEKFFRIQGGDVHNVKGYGLGLSYCAEVIRIHNGQIRIASEIKDGLKILVTLPMA